jgi:hypothetical protein
MRPAAPVMRMTGILVRLLCRCGARVIRGYLPK